LPPWCDAPEPWSHPSIGSSPVGPQDRRRKGRLKAERLFLYLSLFFFFFFFFFIFSTMMTWLALLTLCRATHLVQASCCHFFICSKILLWSATVSLTSPLLFLHLSHHDGSPHITHLAPDLLLPLLHLLQYLTLKS
jgi:hypothetical protein